MEHELAQTYVVTGTVRETSDVVTLTLAPKNGPVTRHTPGQFITVYFPELGVPEGKSYSISSIPNGSTIDITVKAMGVFSNKLCSLTEGDTLSVTEPYGYFHAESDDAPLVMVTGGIGITPFMSMVEHFKETGADRPILLFYSNKTADDIVFHDRLAALAKNHGPLSIRHFITQETPQEAHYRAGRITAASILEHAPEDAEYLLCGSIGFVRDLWRDLKQRGIGDERLYTESFY